MSKGNTVGISGATIQYFDKYIIKTGNNRLFEQARKQYRFNKYIIPSFKTPYILGLDSGIKMERVIGRDWHDFFIFSRTAEIHQFADSLIEYLLYFRNLSIMRDYIGAIISKLDDLVQKTSFAPFMTRCKANLGDSAPLPASFCHGDMTLSNIIFAENIYLIDFLDSFVESYWIDLIKLRQDLVYFWSYSYYNLSSTKCLTIFNYLNNRLNDVFNAEIKNPIFQMLESINILRIEPYAPLDKQWLVEKMLVKTPYYQCLV